MGNTKNTFLKGVVMSTQEQIAELWEAINALQYEVNNVVKNESGNINQKANVNAENITTLNNEQEDNDNLILDHEERIILLEVEE